MALAVKPGYLNPLSMMGKKENGLTMRSPLTRADRKASSVQSLQLQRQTLQNQALLLKSSSDGAGSSQEVQAELEQQMEKVSAQLRTAKAEQARSPETEGADLLRQQAASFDTYAPAAARTESPGLYQLQRDEQGGYKVRFSPFSP